LFHCSIVIHEDFMCLKDYCAANNEAMEQ